MPDPPAHSGALFVNNMAGSITLPGGLGRKSAATAPVGFYGSNGRVWHALTRAVMPANTMGYFPRPADASRYPAA